MGKLLVTLFEIVLPFAIVFHLLPKVWKLVVGDDEPKKKKKSKKLKGYGNIPPPPPRPRRVGSTLIEEHKRLQRQLENYEVRGGRIVRKDPLEINDPSRTARVDVTLDEKPKKKKQFTKGVDPDFL